MEGIQYGKLLTEKLGKPRSLTEDGEVAWSLATTGSWQYHEGCWRKVVLP